MIFRLFYLTASLILVLDIVTKQIVYRSMTLGQSIPVLGDFLKWTYIHNDGAAFGLFQGNRWFFVGVSVLSILVLVTLAHSARYRRPFLLFSLGLILGGAVGNLLDRLWLGEVIDFANFGIGNHRFPFFNIADSGISVGVALLAIQMLREGGANQTAENVDDIADGAAEDAAESPTVGTAADTAHTESDDLNRYSEPNR
ncbi:MAG: signal peptidase II [Candidatus Eisenbacteria bacterium]|uniref:Lipoprotein signal peptidase n=1 Tax=Eiseniibacteriota bacterium TaxID=2212470 RepID=A0A956N8E4_UNCEI|nr:signal peptidase II [Candidatus Eisenbacteria bacterium]MCB9463164.1 signal peptidase II [Candidatus Eisenbacteria bacterium]